MCGIFCLMTKEDSESVYLVDSLTEQIARRGPDFQDSKKWSTRNNIYLHFASSILWMQGEKLMCQPIETSKSIFLYNGNIFGGISEKESVKCSDTLIMLNQLEKTEDICEVLSCVQGPYSFIYLNKVKNKLYFGKDHFGRISLVIGKNNNAVVLSSVAKKDLNMDFIDLPSIGIFCWDLDFDNLMLLPYQFKNPNFIEKMEQLKCCLGRAIEIREVIENKLPLEYVEPQCFNIRYIKYLKNVNTEEAFHILLNDETWMNNVLKLEKLLESALKKRINVQPKFCKNCIKDMTICNHSLIGILFSGGVDCAVLAVLSDKINDKNHPIDLINVSFNEVNNYNSPDRQTGLQTLNELRKICPDREWRFLEINISQKELNDMRKNHISDLIYPLQTVLDDSLGCALWFASRGFTETYCSPSRVLLAGMGADELFGGYTKHRAAFKNGSWLGLHQALDMDWQNLPYRNLARDNRVTCDHGRELRVPYLDENVVEFVRSLPIWEKTCPSAELPQGFGEKLLLRSLAYHLGLKRAAVCKKRALQFGSRIANSKEKAHEVSVRLM